jgi:hypothetical protein
LAGLAAGLLRCFFCHTAPEQNLPLKTPAGSLSTPELNRSKQKPQKHNSM